MTWQLCLLMLVVLLAVEAGVFSAFKLSLALSGS